MTEEDVAHFTHVVNASGTSWIIVSETPPPSPSRTEAPSRAKGWLWWRTPTGASTQAEAQTQTPPDDNQTSAVEAEPPPVTEGFFLRFRQTCRAWTLSAVRRLPSRPRRLRVCWWRIAAGVAGVALVAQLSLSLVPCPHAPHPPVRERWWGGFRPLRGRHLVPAQRLVDGAQAGIGCGDGLRQTTAQTLDLLALKQQRRNIAHLVQKPREA